MFYILKNTIRSALPAPVLSAYHFSLSFLAALLFGFPSRRIKVVGVTGTKGKSSTIEFANAIFEAAGHKTAIASTLRFKIGDNSKRNLSRMTMVGRFALQHFLNDAAAAGCAIAFVEMTSEGARQSRHRFIDLDALVFTNLAPEHIESHGSLEAYIEAKLELGKQLVRSAKRPRFLIANSDDAIGTRFLTLSVEHPLPFSLDNARPWEARDEGSIFTFEDTTITLHLPGTFSIQNALAAALLARALGIKTPTIAHGLSTIKRIPGRAERIEAGQDFIVVVDYAHTPDSLRAIYDAYKNRRRICVLSCTGGGRDTWKRPVMGDVADKTCDHIILTDEDPYDEDPRSIVEAIARGIIKHTPEIIMDRRKAIARGVSLAKTGDAVLITGKGTDPTICGPRGTRIPWSDADIAQKEIQALPKSESKLQ